MIEKSSVILRAFLNDITDGGTILEERDREEDATTGKRLGQLYNAPCE